MDPIWTWFLARTSIRSRSPLELQIRLFNLVEGKLNGLPVSDFEIDQAIGARSQGTFPAARILYRLSQDGFYLFSSKPLKILVFEQLPLHAGRADLERVGPGHNVLHVQNRTHLLRDQFAVAMGDAFGLVDGNSQKPVPSAAFQLDFNNLDSFRLRDPFGDGLDFRENRGAAHVYKPSSNKKVGFRPLQEFDTYNSI